jgi:putative transposase
VTSCGCPASRSISPTTGRYMVFSRGAFSEMTGWHGAGDGPVEIWNGMHGARRCGPAAPASVSSTTTTTTTPRCGVTTSGYYEWRARQADPARRRREDAELTETILEIHRQSRGTYGAPRVHAELRLGEGIGVGRKRGERLMCQAGIAGVYERRKRGCTRRDPPAIPSDDLVNRRFTVTAPDRLWVSDITEHPTSTGKVYLGVVLEAWSGRVVGWSIADHLRAELVVDALQMALWRRRPPEGRIVHSDHGTQYTSWAFGRRRRAAGRLGSMGTVGDGYDNSVAETFFSTPPPGAPRPPALVDAPATRIGDLRMDRSVLQPDPSTLDQRNTQPRRLRTDTSGMITTPTPSGIAGMLIAADDRGDWHGADLQRRADPAAETRVTGAGVLRSGPARVRVRATPPRCTMATEAATSRTGSADARNRGLP